jgi:hypothetical protein
MEDKAGTGFGDSGKGQHADVSLSVSWLLLERGWEVVDAAGEPVGSVDQVLGDPDRDIFEGLRVRLGAGGTAFVPGEDVGRIVEGQVSLRVARSAVGRVDEPG